jgi:hypothetical protein
VSPIRYLRTVARPTGRHRGPRPAEATAPADALMRPVEATANDLAWCPAEERETLHAFLRLGGRQCWVCRTVTTDPTPPGGAE